MNWDAIGAVGEVIGAIAVVVTIAYLAVQIRLNTVQLKESVRSAQLSSLDQALRSFSRYRSLLADEDNAHIYVSGLESYADLSNVEKVRFQAIVEEYVSAIAAHFNRMKDGSHDCLEGKATGAVVNVVRAQGGAAWWSERKHIFLQDFVDEIDRSI